MSTAKGFTLVEIMIAIAIVGILLALGAPALGGFLTNSRIKSMASEMRDGLQTARMEAIRRNEPVCFKTATNPSGWSVFRSDTDCVTAATVTKLRERTARSQESNFILQFTDNAATPTVTTLDSSNSKTIKFTSDGRLDSATAPGFIDIKSNGNNSCKENNGEFACLRVTISSGGLIRSCNPATSGIADSC